MNLRLAVFDTADMFHVCKMNIIELMLLNRDAKFQQIWQPNCISKTTQRLETSPKIWKIGKGDIFAWETSLLWCIHISNVQSHFPSLNLC